MSWLQEQEQTSAIQKGRQERCLPKAFVSGLLSPRIEREEEEAGTIVTPTKKIKQNKKKESSSFEWSCWMRRKERNGGERVP